MRLLTVFNIDFKYFVVPDKKLKKFMTVKKDVEKGAFKRPEDTYW